MPYREAQTYITHARLILPALAGREAIPVPGTVRDSCTVDYLPGTQYSTTPCGQVQHQVLYLYGTTV